MATLGCGKISVNRRGAIRYAVNSIDDLEREIAPFFTRYQLRGKKHYDFDLWREALGIFKRKQQRGQRLPWNSVDRKDLERLREIHEAMKQYKSRRQTEWKWLYKTAV